MHFGPHRRFQCRPGSKEYFATHHPTASKSVDSSIQAKLRQVSCAVTYPQGEMRDPLNSQLSREPVCHRTMPPRPSLRNRHKCHSRGPTANHAPTRHPSISREVVNVQLSAAPGIVLHKVTRRHMCAKPRIWRATQRGCRLGSREARQLPTLSDGVVLRVRQA